MKALKYIIMGMVVSATTSCGNDWLDLEPSTKIPSESAIKNLDDAEYALNGVYDRMRSASYYSGRMVYYGDVAGDDAMSLKMGNRTTSYYLLDFTKDNGPSSHWSYAYNIIQNCNIVLSQIDKLEISESDKEKYNDLKGQALTLRGFALFDLTRLFGYPYAKDNGESLGVPIIKEVSFTTNKPARSTVAQCYDAFIDDLKEGSDLMSEKFNKGKLNKWAGLQLLSRAYLYMGNNKEALIAAQNAIKGAEANGYSLWSNEEYATAWGRDYSAAEPGEVLFELVNTGVESPGNESLGYLNYSQGYFDYCLTTSFYEVMQEDPDDVRRSAYLVTESKLGQKAAFINKYLPQEGELEPDANIYVLRLSELYLIAAEAAVKQSDNANAVKYLDAIVHRANPAKSVQGKTVTLDDVLAERRKELFGEGHRFFDMIRNHKTIVRKEASRTFPEIDVEHLALQPESQSFNWDYYRVVLPIPMSELNANPNMEPNPGYGR